MQPLPSASWGRWFLPRHAISAFACTFLLNRICCCSVPTLHDPHPWAVMYRNDLQATFEFIDAQTCMASSSSRGRVTAADAVACAAAVGNAGKAHKALQSRGALREIPTLDSTRKSSQRQNKQWLQQCTQRRPLCMKDGSEFQWQIAEPALLLQDLLQRSPAFAELLSTLPDVPQQRIALYLDECLPGNPLMPDRRRKICCWYLCFVDACAGLAHMSSSSWVSLAFLRHEISSQACGELSQATAIVVESLRPLLQEGVMLTVSAQRKFFLSCSLMAVLMDEAAMAETWQSKGATGRRPCPSCSKLGWADSYV